MGSTPWWTIVWLEEILKEMQIQGESWADVVSAVFPDTKEDGVETGFTLWTAKRIYVPGRYEGHLFVRSLSRTPDGTYIDPIGGG